MEQLKKDFKIILDGMIKSYFEKEKLTVISIIEAEIELEFDLKFEKDEEDCMQVYTCIHKDCLNQIKINLVSNLYEYFNMFNIEIPSNDYSFLYIEKVIEDFIHQKNIFKYVDINKNKIEFRPDEIDEYVNIQIDE